MSLTRQQIVDEVAKWDAGARTRLLDDLHAMLDDRLEGVSTDELAIYQKRLHELRNGLTESMSLDEVMKQTLDHLKREASNP